MREILENLMANGFTEYEAKAYVALVGLGMATAREISEISGVPQGRIYDILKSLAAKGYIAIQEGTPTFYRAEDPEIAFNALKMDLCQSIDESVRYLKSQHIETRPQSPFWSIHSERGIKNRFRTLIMNATEELIIIAMDPDVLKWGIEDLKRARKRVDLYILVDRKNKYTGMNLRVHEMNYSLNRFFLEMNSKGPKMRRAGWQTALYMIVDGNESITIGHQSEKKMALITRMPPYCYVMKRLIEMLDPSVGRQT